MTEEVFEKAEAHDHLGFVHISEETAVWLQDELKEFWEMGAGNDSLHYTYHLTKALMELRSELRMEIDQ